MNFYPINCFAWNCFCYELLRELPLCVECLAIIKLLILISCIRYLFILNIYFKISFMLVHLYSTYSIKKFIINMYTFSVYFLYKNKSNFICHTEIQIHIFPLLIRVACRCRANRSHIDYYRHSSYKYTLRATC